MENSYLLKRLIVVFATIALAVFALIANPKKATTPTNDYYSACTESSNGLFKPKSWTCPPCETEYAILRAKFVDDADWLIYPIDATYDATNFCAWQGGGYSVGRERDHIIGTYEDCRTVADNHGMRFGSTVQFEVYTLPGQTNHLCEYRNSYEGTNFITGNPVNGIMSLRAAAFPTLHGGGLNFTGASEWQFEYRKPLHTEYNIRVTGYSMCSNCQGQTNPETWVYEGFSSISSTNVGRALVIVDQVRGSGSCIL